MIVSLFIFWSIYGLILGALLYLLSVPLLASFAVNLANSLLVGLFFYLSWQFTNYIWGKSTWIPKEKVSPKNRAVFITGCDTGFGHNLAKRLDNYGFHVYAGCLFPSGEGAKCLQRECSNRLTIVKLDVTKDEDVIAA